MTKSGHQAGVLLGIDAGLTVTKAAAFDLRGHQLAVASASCHVHSPSPRCHERDMDELWQHCAAAIRECLGQLSEEAGPVLAVGLCGHSDGAYLVDDQGVPVRPAILATDSRAYEYADSVRATPKRDLSLKLTGQVPFAGSHASVLAWLRDHEPDVLVQARWLLSCKDWLRLRLTGEIATDPSDASASFTDVHTQTWSDDALELFGVSAIRELLPDIRGSTEVSGVVTPSASAATGLRVGTPVVIGSHDVDAAAIGIGAVNPGTLSLVMGTFSINQVIWTSPVVDERWQARSYINPGRWLHMSTSPSSASNLDWFVRNFGPHDDKGVPDPAAAVQIAMKSYARGDSPQPVFVPFLNGSPYGTEVAGGLVHMRGWHDQADVLRAILEGIVFNHRTHVDALREGFVLDDCARLCGGGSRSAEWSQLLADALGMVIEVTDAEEAGARGASVLAGVGVGVWDDVDQGVRETVRLRRAHEPRPKVRDRLEADYVRYQAVVAALREL